MEKLGCSVAVALRYARLVGQARWEAAGADLADDPLGAAGPTVG